MVLTDPQPARQGELLAVLKVRAVRHTSSTDVASSNCRCKEPTSQLCFMEEPKAHRGLKNNSFVQPAHLSVSRGEIFFFFAGLFHWQ